MDTGEIKKLIEAFYNGETSPEEEQILSDYFNGKDVSDDLLDEKELFLNMYKNDPIEVPEKLESKLNILIDKLDDEEKIKQKRKKLWIQVGSIAAGIALLITAGLYFNKGQETINPDKPSLTSQVSVEDQAKIKEAQEALMLLSANFNKGVEQVEFASANLNKANEILNKTFKQ
ncbi:hypothetical protein GGR21_001957 [Dysgonomonas hofstadii]|uniref:Uncharacterized protein n=1 Tax=Dysgonomonas hofstadii TaxID=637886 RepID=A0A840CL14_9BACT|nr:hypothetical protein [Dysgonomonas hofstadii]MBB4036056.1 hypothetical protein [Dysgonomonas hofstadii]